MIIDCTICGHCGCGFHKECNGHLILNPLAKCECSICGQGTNINRESKMNLTITKERVLEAAKGCKDAEKTLKVLFPEAFQNEKTVPKVNGNVYLFPQGHPMRSVIQINISGSADMVETGLCLLNYTGYSFSLEEKPGFSFLRVTKK